MTIIKGVNLVTSFTPSTALDVKLPPWAVLARSSTCTVPRTLRFVQTASKQICAETPNQGDEIVARKPLTLMAVASTLPCGLLCVYLGVPRINTRMAKPAFLNVSHHNHQQSTACSLIMMAGMV